MRCKNCGKAIVEYKWHDKITGDRVEHYIRHRGKSRRCACPESAENKNI